jgi:uncharacterized protein YjdB/uncharacterized membrane protein
VRQRFGLRSIFGGVRRGFALVRVLQVLFGVLAITPAIWLACSDERIAGPLPVVQVKITPESLTMIQGQSVKLTGFALDKTFAFLVGKKVSWSTLDASIVTVDDSGMVVALTPGSTGIVAAVSGHADTADVTVVPVPVDSVVVAPAAATVILTQKRQLTAATFDSNGVSLTGRTVTWDSDNSAIAQVDSTGLVTAVALGGAVITATSEGISATAGITVVPVPVATVTVTPSPLDVQLGGTGNLTATTKDSIGGVLTGRAVAFSSNDVNVATVDNTGVVTGVANGTATITATSEGKTGTATVNVSVPVITLSANTANFTAQAFGGDPAPQAINVTNGGLFSLTGLSVGIVYGSGNGWLTAGLNQASAPASLSLQPSTSGLAVGTYTATVTVSSSVTGVASKTVAVSFTVTQQPIITLSGNTAVFTVQAFGNNPAAQLINVTNTGAGTLSGLSLGVVYNVGSGWLNANLDNTTAPATLTLQAVTGTLVAGTYTATVTVSSSVAGVTSKTVNVTFNVTQQPIITLGSTTLNYTAQAFASNPASQASTVTNTGAGTLSGLSAGISYIGATTGWLSATLGTTTAPTSVTVQPATGTLAAGTYQATVTVASTVPGVASATIAVTFTVTPQPVISLSATTANFGATPGGPDPSSQAVNITNTGGGTLSGLGTSINYTNGSGWLGATLDQTTAPATLTIQPITGALTTGTYVATITVSSTVPGVASQTVTVSFAISSTPIISLSSGSATFTDTASQTLPASQGVNITNTGGGTLSGLSTGISYGPGATGWLTASLGATTAPTSVTLQVNTTALAGGSYSATVTISSSLPGVASQTISVTNNVAAEQVIGLSSTTVNFTAQAFGGNPVSQGVTVSNTGTGTLNGLSAGVSYLSGAGWLTTASLGATTTPTTLTLQPTTAGLAAGTYTAIVTVSSSIPAAVSKTVTVNFTVTPQPVISLSTGSLSFNAQAFAAPPASQPVTITNTGGGSLTGLSTGIAYTTGSGWLSASLNQTFAPATMTVTANPGSLSAGTYNATITISSTVPGVASNTVNVSFTVTQQPIITRNPTTLTFTAQAFGSPTASQGVNITNTGGGSLTGLAIGIVYNVGIGWLSASLNQTTAPATITVSANPVSIIAGTYTATINITSTVPGVAGTSVGITFNVTQQPIITVTPASLTTTQTRGNNLFPAVSITNTGAGTLSGMSLSSNAAWLTASLTSTTAPATMNVTIATSTLGAGGYVGVITVSSTVPGVASNTYTVNLTVQQPQVGVSTNSVTLATRIVGTATTTSAFVTVSNTGAGTLDGLSCSSNAGWLSCSLNSGTAPATLTITGNPSGLARGNYGATITVSSTRPGTSSQFISTFMLVTYSYATHVSGLVRAPCDGCHSKLWTYANLVSVVNPGEGSCAAGTWWMALSGAPNSSLIYRKLIASPPCGVRMPQGCTTSCYSTATTDVIFYWILDGVQP